MIPSLPEKTGDALFIVTDDPSIKIIYIPFSVVCKYCLTELNPNDSDLILLRTAARLSAVCGRKRERGTETHLRTYAWILRPISEALSG